MTFGPGSGALPPLGRAGAAVPPPPDISSPRMSANRASVQRPGAAPALAGTALPDRWQELWGHPADPAPLDWHRIERLSHELATALPARDATAVFGPLVGSEELRHAPVHRWFAYKEGYSPSLLGAVVDALELGDGLQVVDSFGGVATTALAGQRDPRVREVRSLEYSPLAGFVGRTKLSWSTLDARRLRDLLPEALAYASNPDARAPELADFGNSAIFHPQTVRALVSARDHVRQLAARPHERDFFLLGGGAVVEDLSGAMKDGRALRIRRGRKRRATSLADHAPAVPATGRVKRALAGQWSAMIADLEALQDERATAAATRAHHVAGDARDLRAAELPSGDEAFPAGWADLCCFSPPYLNFIDYTEVHKMELWLLEHVTNQDEFRQTRLGTLRSHPSVKFSERDYFAGVQGEAVELVGLLSAWMGEQAARREVAPVVRQYFEDMLQVWREQLRVLRDGGTSVCVVANSTFSFREPEAGDGEGRRERWRMPVLTDVILGHLALLAGFSSAEIWTARELRPRNVSASRARESLVVVRK